MGACVVSEAMAGRVLKPVVAGLQGAWGVEMLRFLKFLVLIPLAAVLVLLALANRNPVTLTLDPSGQAAPILSLTMPLFVALFAAAAIGIVIGGCAAWLAQGDSRRERRQFKRELAQLKTHNAEGH